MKIINIFILTIFLLVSSLKINAKDDKLELGIRYLKLGNTYREGANFNLALKFLSDGIKLVEKSNGFKAKYWTAAGNEFLGYLYKDMKFSEDAIKHFDLAAAQYKKIIIQEDGSPQAMSEILNGLSRTLKLKSESIQNDKTESNDILNLSNSKLRVLPENISKTTKSLILKDNKFREFPDIISSLNELEYLDLSGNKIKELPASIESLINLHYLNLANNKINKISESISSLINLKELNLENNKLKDIPQGINELKGLKILNLKGNKLNFEKILNLVRSLPNTNIIFDEYIQKKETEIITGEED